MRTSISFFPNKLKQSTKTGRIPLYLRVLHSNEKAEARLNEEITEQEFFKWNSIIMRLDVRDSLLNSKLNTISKCYDEFKIMNGTKLHHFSAKKIRDLLIGNGEKKDQKVNEYVNNYYVTAITSNCKLSNGTKAN